MGVDRWTIASKSEGTTDVFEVQVTDPKRQLRRFLSKSEFDPIAEPP